MNRKREIEKERGGKEIEKERGEKEKLSFQKRMEFEKWRGERAEEKSIRRTLTMMF